MTSARSNIRITNALPILSALSALMLAAGCSNSGPSRHWSRSAEPVEPAVSAGAVPAAPVRSVRGKPFDPFAAEIHGEIAGGFTANQAMSASQTPAPSPGPRFTPTSGANPGGLSVFGDVATEAPRTSERHDGAENLTQVSFATEGADFDPCVSRDGRSVVFASTQHRATADIYLKRVGGRSVTQLTSDPGNDVTPKFSPEGARIAFSSDRSGIWNIYIMNSTGGQAVQVTDDTDPQLHPSWSPDGSMLAYCRLSSASGRWELWVTDLNNAGVKRFLGYGLFPEWSPLGDKIMFQRSRERGDRLFSVWTLDYVNGEGQNPTEVVSSATAAIVNPSWSMDGRRIAFTTIANPTHEYGQRPDSADLWIANIDGSGRANVTGGRFVNLMPTWGPDNRLFFISDRGGRDNIWSLAPEKAILAAAGPGAVDLAQDQKSPMQSNSAQAGVPDSDN